MKYDDIMKLVNAGFTAEQIQAMEAPTPAPDPTPTPAPDPTPAQDTNTTQAPAPDPAPAPTPAPVPDLTATLGAMQQTINQLAAAVQAGMLRTAQTSAPTVEDTPEILAHIINPYTKEEVK